MAREVWTDERLDDLNARVDRGFGEMREEFAAIRGEMGGEFKSIRGEMRGEFKAVRSEMEGIRAEIGTVRGELVAVRSELGTVRGELVAVRGEIGAFNRTVMQLIWGVLSTMFLGFMGTIAAIITQL